ncbi:MAG: NifU family protein [Ignavibacteriae bacterium]|nr:NifU family protein [Ignavibacteria bacterium]MBI3365237.1 NifU family protein [Ignavibacteriota bacterium]
MMGTEVGLSLQERVEQALETCRSFLRADGGDVELVSITDDGIVDLRYHGTCVICPMSRMTLRAGLERAILRAAPEIKRVEAVNVR